MKLKLKIIALSTLLSFTATAGNEDRIGSAGSAQLLINPWSRSVGWGGAGGAHIKGLGALQLNVAGLALADKTEIMFSRTNWMLGTGINVNSIGLAQRVGESNVIGLSFMTMGFGDIPITTEEIPEGGIGTFSPSSFMLNIAFAKEFSSSITGGFNLKILNEGISNASASGIAIDAGVRYVTGENDHIKFGLSLKNIGPPMKYSGDGFAIETVNPFTEIATTTEQRTANFELPSLINISGAYDFIFNEKNKLTVAATFTSNSFTRDQYRAGGEYTFDATKVLVVLRVGMVYENGLFSDDERQTALSGPSAGVSLELPFGKDRNTMGVDYSFRSGPLGGFQSVGIRLNLTKSSEED